MARGVFDRSTGDAYSFMAHDPTSDIFRGPCKPVLLFVSLIGLMTLSAVRYFCHFMEQIFENVHLKNHLARRVQLQIITGPHAE
jgi:hypothetical protein